MSEAQPGDWRPGRLALVPGDSLSTFPTCRESEVGGLIPAWGWRGEEGWGRRCHSPSWPAPAPTAGSPRGQWLGGGRLRANSRANGCGPAPRGPLHRPPTPTPSPGQGRGPPASARSAAIHHLDPWRALTAAPAALTRLTKQFATSHLLDRLLARPPLKEPCPPPLPQRGAATCSVPSLRPATAPSRPKDTLVYSWPSLTTPKVPPHTHLFAVRPGPSP